MIELTARQQQIFDFIREFMETEGFPPHSGGDCGRTRFSFGERGRRPLEGADAQGSAERHPWVLRGASASAAAAVAGAGYPSSGRVAAGHPILAETHLQGHYRIDPGLFRPRADYLLQVRGMSMRDAGILDGDLLAVHRTPEAALGDIVVARVDDEVTVKRFRRRGNIVRLMPENEDYEPIVVDLRREALVLEGVGVGIIRNEGL